jgi:hypothetical protein
MCLCVPLHRACGSLNASGGQATRMSIRYHRALSSPNSWAPKNRVLQPPTLSATSNPSIHTLSPSTHFHSLIPSTLKVIIARVCTSGYAHQEHAAHFHCMHSAIGCMDGQNTLKDLQRLAPLCVVGCPSQDANATGLTSTRGLLTLVLGTTWGSSGCGHLLVWLFGSLPCVVFVCASLVCRQNPLQVALIRLAGQTTVWSMGAP